MASLIRAQENKVFSHAYANTKKSTGPKTAEGKESSSSNRVFHGFRSACFDLLPGESAEEFESLSKSLHEEHQPQTATERLLVQKLAEHHWLAQRARDFQTVWLDHDGTIAFMNLWLRYESQNDRAFHKCLAELRKIREERRKREKDEAAPSQRAEDSGNGFERQKEAEEAMATKKEANDAKVRLANAKAEHLELETAIKGMMQAPALFENLPQKQDLAQAA